MSRPSEPLLTWLRQVLAKKKLNTAAVADKVGLSRKRVRQVLSGAEAMTVDELVQITDAIELAPAEMLGMADLPAAPEPAENVQELENDNACTVTPWGNQPRQLFEVGFTLGCDFLFVADTHQLADSGIPAHVLETYRDRPIPLKLDAAYHRHHNPSASDNAIKLTLSFDALYEVEVPWTAVLQVAFYPEPPSLPDDPESEEEEEPADDGRPPFLRLVT